MLAPFVVSSRVNGLTTMTRGFLRVDALTTELPMTLLSEIRFTFLSPSDA
jgi:hypothetical protein